MNSSASAGAPRTWTPKDILFLGVASFGGLGLVPAAPRTFGTLGGVLIAWLLAGSRNFLLYTLLLALGLYVVGRIVQPWVEARAGADPGFFVLDEVVGYLVTIAWAGGPTLLALLAAFVVFRYFDTVKLPPARHFERFRGGDGLLLDDLVAGVYGLFTMAVLRLVFLEPASWDASLAPLR
ncbi:Phosphatidylglycerophosphatase A [Planctomycetes bacterium Poly30]|uniref:Phosphatidylglycerophosphatase A n=1 Tax=Saltatorellus ferox TaxID=2528018 RepID=A0A518F054_9BACT|nr:Phosphatidylglycerophosphatase A [Planctomycetes bacterium Poly30]